MTAAPTPAQSAGLREVVAEFGRHLDLLAEQLSASLMEADRDSITVGQSFHELSAVKATIAALQCPEPARSTIEHSCTQMGASIHNAVVALQYHDRLSQRLGLVRAALDRLQGLMRESPPRSHRDWLDSLRNVEHLNRIEQKRLGPALEAAPADEASSSVELF